jgi:hypothetical protein
MGVDIAIYIDKFFHISLYRELSTSLYVSYRRHPHLINSQSFLYVRLTAHHELYVLLLLLLLLLVY